jgi:hypothetical protein
MARLLAGSIPTSRDNCDRHTLMETDLAMRSPQHGSTAKPITLSHLPSSL